MVLLSRVSCANELILLLFWWFNEICTKEIQIAQHYNLHSPTIFSFPAFWHLVDVPRLQLGFGIWLIEPF